MKYGFFGKGLAVAVSSLAFYSSGCRECPETFVGDLSDSALIAEQCGGRVYRSNSLDLDSDGKEDNYMMTGSGVAFGTSSRRISSGEEGLADRLWVRVDPNL